MAESGTTYFERQRAELKELLLPEGWDLIAGADSGTYMSAGFVAISPEPYEALAIAEFPNYRYVGGEIELLDLSIGEWAWEVTEAWKIFSEKTCKPWIDVNTQFASELLHHGIAVQKNRKAGELRVEITREYFQHRKIRLAPWLEVLPYELEEAVWPPDVSGTTGRNMRLKTKDHTLDFLEHALSRRPRSKRLKKSRDLTFLEKYLAQHKRQDRDPGVDRHLGRNA